MLRRWGEFRPDAPRTSSPGVPPVGETVWMVLRSFTTALQEIRELSRCRDSASREVTRMWLSLPMVAPGSP